jgi:hypothetical protein
MTSMVIVYDPAAGSILLEGPIPSYLCDFRAAVLMPADSISLEGLRCELSLEAGAQAVDYSWPPEGQRPRRMTSRAGSRMLLPSHLRVRWKPGDAVIARASFRSTVTPEGKHETFTFTVPRPPAPLDQHGTPCAADDYWDDEEKRWRFPIPRPDSDLNWQWADASDPASGWVLAE